MSRIGNRKITIPEGVTATIVDNTITVKGPKGELSYTYNKDITVTVNDNSIEVTRPNDLKLIKSLHGTTNALIQNMIIGVTKGYSKGLEIVGVGYRFNVQGSNLIINAGYSHPVTLTIPEGIKAEVKDNTQLTLSGIDKELLG